MAEQTKKTRIVLRNDIISNWLRVDPILLKGELSICYDPSVEGDRLIRVKVGDGVSKWSELPYVNDYDDVIEEIKGDIADLRSDLNKKVEKEVVGASGKAYIFNESDGGGAQFVHNDGSEAFIGVNDGGINGMMAQIYADVLEGGRYVGSRINVYHDHIYYTPLAAVKSGIQRNDAEYEIVVKKDIKGLVGALHFRGVFNSLDEVTDPKNGDVVIVGTKEYVYVVKEGEPAKWVEFGDEAIYATKAEVAAIKAALELAIANEQARAQAEEAKKVDKLIESSGNKAYIFNEADGGGAKFEHADGSEAYVGVNNGGKDGMMAQIYADVEKDGQWSGSRINVYNNKIFYQSQAETDAGTAKNAAKLEIAVKGDLDGKVDDFDILDGGSASDWND